MSKGTAISVNLPEAPEASVGYEFIAAGELIGSVVATGPINGMSISGTLIEPNASYLMKLYYTQDGGTADSNSCTVQATLDGVTLLSYPTSSLAWRANIGTNISGSGVDTGVRTHFFELNFVTGATVGDLQLVQTVLSNAQQGARSSAGGSRIELYRVG